MQFIPFIILKALLPILYLYYKPFLASYHTIVTKQIGKKLEFYFIFKSILKNNSQNIIIISNLFIYIYITPLILELYIWKFIFIFTQLIY